MLFFFCTARPSSVGRLVREKAEPPALLHGRRLQRAPCKAGWCLRRGRDKATERVTGLQKNGIENEAAYTKKPTHFFSTAGSKLTWKRSENQLTPLTRPILTQGGATELACGMPSSWRGDCRECWGAGMSRNHRDSADAGLIPNAILCVIYFQHRVSRVPCAPGINDRRGTHKMCWVRSRKQIEGPGAQLASTVAGDVPPCQP